MLCGDEINAIVVDVGSQHCRFGAAGQNMPHHIFTRDEVNFTAPAADDGASPSSDFSLRELTPDGVESILSHGIAHSMRLQPSEYALMVAQGAWCRDHASQERLLEICLESLQSPAVFAMPSSSLSAFGMGKSTALVIDAGHSGTTISPVVDGFEMKNAVIRTSRGGHHIDEQLRSKLREVSASQYFQQKTQRKIYVVDAAQDFKHLFGVIPSSRMDGSVQSAELFAQLGTSGASQFALPDGTFVNPSFELCTTAERVFFPMTDVSGRKKRARDLLTSYPNVAFDYDSEALHDLVYCSSGRVDVDARKELLANIAIVGGCSLTKGLNQRFSKELSDIVPSHFKVKLLNGQSMEKQHAAWIGGSILSICGSFEQLWVSKQEYDEHGASRMVKERFIY